MKVSSNFIILGISIYLLENIHNSQLFLANKKGNIRKTVHRYDRVFDGNLGPVGENLVIEASLFGNPEPYTTQTISSYIQEFMTRKKTQDLLEKYNMFSFDVGIDVWGYAPVPWDAIVEKKKRIHDKIDAVGGRFVDGEFKASGVYDKDPDQRMLDTRSKNKEIMQHLGYDIDERMWPTELISKDRTADNDE